MLNSTKPRESSTLFDPRHARWLLGVLGTLIAVVGADNLLGVILRQARSEIASLIDAEPNAPAPKVWYSNN
jgi:hypothetical protein